MRKFIISAAAMSAFAALLASAPAMAEYHFGPTQNGNQCWIGNGGAPAIPGRVGGSSGYFGYWGACPKPASATATPAPRHVRKRHT
jgi:hypothetical protein